MSGPKSCERGLRVRNLSRRGSKGVKKAGVLKGRLCCGVNDVLSIRGEGRAYFELIGRDRHKLVRVFIFSDVMVV